MTQWSYISYSATANNQDNSEDAVDTSTEIESQTETQIESECISADARAQETNSGESVPSKAVTPNDLWSQEKEETFLSSSFTAESLDIHSYFKCRNSRCESLSSVELTRLKAKSGDKFQHHWISDKSLTFCKA